jgi:hypothetical protein
VADIHTALGCHISDAIPRMKTTLAVNRQRIDPPYQIAEKKLHEHARLRSADAVGKLSDRGRLKR